MRGALLLLALPLRAPMLLVLLLVSVYMGLHWADVDPLLIREAEGSTAFALAGPFFWPLQCLQAVLVVVLCRPVGVRGNAQAVIVGRPAGSYWRAATSTGRALIPAQS